MRFDVIEGTLRRFLSWRLVKGDGIRVVPICVIGKFWPNNEMVLSSVRLWKVKMVEASYHMINGCTVNKPRLIWIKIGI